MCETRNTPTQNDHILRENTLLKETNEALKAELLEYKSKITQINAKLSTAENEIASLLTVIRVLNENRAVTISPKRRKEIISSSRANSEVASARQPVIVDHDVSLNNRYSCLDTENGDKASMDGDGHATHSKQKESDVIEVISNASTGVSEQQGNTDNTSNNNTTLQLTNSNNYHSNKTSTVQTVRENNDKRVARDSPIILIGDSIVKNINPRKISKRRVVKRTFPGKNAEEIKSEINSVSTEPNPLHVIIHAGTNNIPNDTVGECVENIENLANCAEQIFPNSLIGLSSITVRNDINVNTKVKEVNKELEKLCEKKGFKFIDNKNIDNSCLNGSNLHLNSKGSAFLATNFIKFIRGKDVQPHHLPQRIEDFRLPPQQLHLLENLVKIFTPSRVGRANPRTYQ